MAPSGDDDSSHPKGRDHDLETAFESLRRYADEGMETLVRGLIDLPSVFNRASQTSRWEPHEEATGRGVKSWAAVPRNIDGEKSWDHGENRSSPKPSDQPNTGGTSFDRSADVNVRAWNQMLEKVGFQSQTQLEEMLRLLEDPAGQHPFSQDLGPFSLLQGRNLPTDLWLARYLTFSPYSPTNLERHNQLGQFGPYWRHAFEDLLDTQDGGDMLPDGPRYASLRPLDWIQLMAERAAPLSRRASAESACQRDDAFGCAKKNSDSFTELDMYERFLNLQSDEGSEEQPERPHENEQLRDSLATEKDTKAPEITTHATTGGAKAEKSLGIIATLTTTERIVLPDGTTHTKVVLKKRFEDGREESSETVHTAQGRREGWLGKGGDTNAETGKQERKPKEPAKNLEKKSWFWS